VRAFVSLDRWYRQWQWWEEVAAAVAAATIEVSGDVCGRGGG
jgi:hypothetical protein